MITVELLKQNDKLSALSDEQRSIIAELSKNDEQTVVAAKYKELLDPIDAMVKEMTGIEKNGLKTSDYFKAALAKGKEMQTTNEALKAEIADLKSKQITDADIQKQLATKDATIADITGKFNALKKEKDALVDNHAKQMKDYRISSDITSALAGITFKEGISEQALAVLKQNGVDILKSLAPDYIDAGDGTQRLVFHKDGAEMRNPDNQLNLYTAQELLKAEFAKMGILAEMKQQGGTGGGQVLPLAQGLAGAKTRREAYELIAQIVKERGYESGTMAYINEQNKLIGENKELIMKLDA